MNENLKKLIEEASKNEELKKKLNALTDKDTVVEKTIEIAKDDWACDEVSDLGTRDNPFTWSFEGDWEAVLTDIGAKLTKYLKTEGVADKLNELDGVAVGFVDGDLVILK